MCIKQLIEQNEEQLNVIHSILKKRIYFNLKLFINNKFLGLYIYNFIQIDDNQLKMICLKIILFLAKKNPLCAFVTYP